MGERSLSARALFTMKFKERATVLEAEIVALEGAIETIRNEQVRPNNPACDGAFSLLKQSLAAIDHDRESKQFAVEKEQRLAAAQTALEAMKRELASHQAEVVKLEAIAAEGLQKMKAGGDRLNKTIAAFEASYQAQIEAMRAIVASHGEAFRAVTGRNLLVGDEIKFNLPAVSTLGEPIRICESQAHRHAYENPQPPARILSFEERFMQNQPTQQEREARRSQTPSGMDFTRSPVRPDVMGGY